MCRILATCCTFPLFSSRFLLGHTRTLKTLPHSSTNIQYLASTMMEGEAKLLTYPPESHGEILNLKQWMHLPAHREDQKFAMHPNFVIPTRQPINCILQVKILSWLKAHSFPWEKGLLIAQSPIIDLQIHTPFGVFKKMLCKFTYSTTEQQLVSQWKTTELKVIFIQCSKSLIHSL